MAIREIKLKIKTKTEILCNGINVSYYVQDIIYSRWSEGIDEWLHSIINVDVNHFHALSTMLA